MLHDIYPYIFDNSYKKLKPEEGDSLLVYNGRHPLISQSEEGIAFPAWKDACSLISEADVSYGFSIDDERYFIYRGREAVAEEAFPGFGFAEYHMVQDSLSPKHRVYAACVGGHLSIWYRENRFCGCCGGAMVPSETERAMKCPECGHMEYPRINPVVIVGITDGDRLLCTKYAVGYYQDYALVAGFVEFGETLEEAIQREVLEEVGLKVKNIRYYNCQPWPASNSLITGWFCDLDGSAQVSLDDGELRAGEWLDRDDIALDDDDVSVTGALMQAFKDGKE